MLHLGPQKQWSQKFLKKRLHAHPVLRQGRACAKGGGGAPNPQGSTYWDKTATEYKKWAQQGGSNEAALVFLVSLKFKVGTKNTRMCQHSLISRKMLVSTTTCSRYARHNAPKCFQFRGEQILVELT